jgi:hypothetical protein
MSPVQAGKTPQNVILFGGHMIDATDRRVSRFQRQHVRKIPRWCRRSFHAVGGIQMTYRTIFVEFPNEPILD